MSTLLIIAILGGIAASLAGGAMSGWIIGKDALGAEMAASMGGLHGLVGGAAAVIIGIFALTILAGV